jgi:hypothetical protein
MAHLIIIGVLITYAVLIYFLYKSNKYVLPKKVKVEMGKVIPFNPNKRNSYPFRKNQ